MNFQKWITLIKIQILLRILNQVLLNFIEVDYYLK